MKIYITGLPSGYDVEHLVRLFYPMAPLTLTPPAPEEDCVWASCGPEGLTALVREQGRSRTAAAPLPETDSPAFALASLTYGLLREWTGLRPPWGKMTGVRPVRLIHDKRAAGWTAEQIDRYFLERIVTTMVEVEDGIVFDGIGGLGQHPQLLFPFPGLRIAHIAIQILGGQAQLFRQFHGGCQAILDCRAKGRTWGGFSLGAGEAHQGL